MSYNQIFVSEEQQAVIRTAAASIEPCWRERFLASVQDQLLGHEPDRPISDDQVVKAIDGERGAM
jgi:hypothetical protein